jgi:hypothetical protein
MPAGPSPLPDATPSAAPSAGADWPAQAADTIERVVGSVRDKTTGPAITVARALVYGTFALLVGTSVAILLAISGVRALDVYLPDAVFGEDHTWVAHAIIGGIFTIGGMVMWSQRSSRGDAE